MTARLLRVVRGVRPAVLAWRLAHAAAWIILGLVVEGLRPGWWWLIAPPLDCGGGYLLKMHARRATSGERTMPLPGDELVPDPMVQTTHAVTIHAPPQRVWPWLVPDGERHPGYYQEAPFWERSAEWNHNRLSARQPTGQRETGERATARDPAVAARQNPRVGDIIADGPSGTAYYRVHQAEPHISLVLFTDTHLRCLLPARLRDSPLLGISGQLSDSYLLTEPEPGTTRLVRRMRLTCAPWLFRGYVALLAWGDAMTGRTVLRGVKQRAESGDPGSRASSQGA